MIEPSSIHQPFLKAVPFCELNFQSLLQSFHFSFQTPEEAKALAAYLSRFYPASNRNLTELGLNEIFFNAIEHGNLNITFQEKSILKKTKKWEKEFELRLKDNLNKNKNVRVYFEVTPSYLCIQIQDEGEGLNHDQLENSNSLNPTSPHGKGLLLAKELSFDRIEVSDKGNVVVCWVYLQKALPGIQT